MIKCYPSGRLMTSQQYWFIYNKVLLEREEYWDQIYLRVDELCG